MHYRRQRRRKRRPRKRRSPYGGTKPKPAHKLCNGRRCACRIPALARMWGEV